MNIDEYLKGILGQILNSYKILTELDDEDGDLDVIKKELSKIKGLLQVINTKLNDQIGIFFHLIYY